MKQRLISVLFAVSVFVSAFLLFQVQPLISKAILPWFGGTPNVWTTCLLFFQTVLFGGYVYAHLLTDRLRPKWQAVVHIVLLTSAVILIQIVPNDSWKPVGGDSPVLRILGVLLVTVGLPYFVLSTTGPLLQAWFGRTFPGRSPYRLYALSNFGSLLALLSYPFVFEPVIGMGQQAALWTIAFMGLAVLCGLCAITSASAQFPVNDDEKSPAEPNTSEGESGTDEVVASRWWQWFGLSMIASVMLLATTNQVCQDVAVIPFLWVVPLSLYLLTFILCFESENWYSRLWYGLGGAFCVAMVTYLMTFPAALSFASQIFVYFAGLFAVCMVCHGELARLKPEPKRLTAFYLTMAAGGACGGLFVGVLAPMIFPLYLEMHFGLVICCVLTMAVYFHENSRREEGDQMPVWGHLGGFVVIIGVAIILQSQASAVIRDAVEIERNFYGVLRIEDAYDVDASAETLNLRHGRILHGVQFKDPQKRMIPTTYYGENSGVGRTMNALHEHREQLKIGVVGLGVGTLSTYGQEGDLFRYYEINDAVVRIAQDKFSFLSQTPSQSEMIIGDARLMLEQEPDQKYDLLVLDAFSGDSVPTHLLTKEAAAVYRRHLAPNGVLAIHISNLHFDLKPVAAAIAEEVGLDFRIARGGFQDETAEVPNLWLIASDDSAILSDPNLMELVKPSPEERVLWTDDFSNLFTVLHKKLF
ncbi:fused MFS/spermidine synthase [Thalassoglobus sp. JC818]|uniref:fused MFS/spermidine synthase n=1 Tax=Thalassoglobus sp. JC818 TaxID=3232136 RepID=UPI0034579C9D